MWCVLVLPTYVLCPIPGIAAFVICAYIGVFDNFVLLHLIPFHSIVEYATYEDMKNAIRKLNGTDLNGRKIRLIEDYRGRKKR